MEPTRSQEQSKSSTVSRKYFDLGINVFSQMTKVSGASTANVRISMWSQKWFETIPSYPTWSRAVEKLELVWIMAVWGMRQQTDVATHQMEIGVTTIPLVTDTHILSHFEGGGMTVEGGGFKIAGNSGLRNIIHEQCCTMHCIDKTRIQTKSKNCTEKDI